MLTQQEIEEMDAITGLKSTPVADTTAQNRIAELRSLRTAKTKEEPKKDNILQTVGKDILSTLVVKPAARATEAITRTLAPNSLAAKGYEAMADEGESQKFDMPLLGDIEVEQQKALGEGGGRQIASDALKVGSYLFPYGKVATGLGARGLIATNAKLTPLAVKSAKVLGNVGSGAAGGYMADVGFNLADEDKTLGESFTPGLGTAAGTVIPLAGPAFKGAKSAIKGTKTAEDVTKRIIQGGTKDIPLAEQAFKNIDTTGVKTRQELSSKLQEAMENQMNIVDTELAKDTRVLPLDNYAIRQVNNAGQEVKTDVISEAFNNLDELYASTGDDLSRSNLNLIKEKAMTEGLTHQEVNNIARMYSQEFGSKAFNKMGDPLTSVNAQKFENVRKQLKQSARGGLGFGEEATKADKLYSAMSNTKKLIDKGAEGVNKLESRLKDRNVLQKLSYGAVKMINALTGGMLKSGIEALGVSNVGNKIDNWVNLEKSLADDLKFIEKANSIKEESALIKYIEDFSKNFKFPGDMAVDDITKRVDQFKKTPNKQGGFISIGGEDIEITPRIEMGK